MFSMAPNIVLVPNMTQNAERKHRTQDTDTANFRSWCNIPVHPHFPELISGVHKWECPLYIIQHLLLNPGGIQEWGQVFTFAGVA